jgi:hypothetical protein
MGRKAEEEQGRRLRAAEAERLRARAPAQYDLHQLKLSTASPLHLSTGLAVRVGHDLDSEAIVTTLILDDDPRIPEAA